jgi:hypothetical protein
MLAVDVLLFVELVDIGCQLLAQPMTGARGRKYNPECSQPEMVSLRL